MTKDELLKKLEELPDNDPESSHRQADELLLEFINDAAITEAFEAINKWYA